MEEVRIDLTLHDGAPATFSGRGENPRGDRHVGGHIERRRSVDNDDVVDPVELEGIAVAALSGPGRAREGAGVVVAGDISGSGARALVEAPRGDRTGG